MTFAEEIDIFLLATERPLLGKLLLNAALAFFSRWHRHNIALLEEVKQLSWHLFERLLGQFSRVVSEVTEGHELHDVGLHILFVSLGVERHLVSVKDIHALEVVAAHAYNDDTQGEVAASHDLVNCLLHVIDDSVGDDQQDLVLLVHLIYLLALCHIVDELNYWSKVGWAVEIHIFQGILVGLNNAVKTIDFRVENVAIQGEAMRSTVG